MYRDNNSQRGVSGKRLTQTDADKETDSDADTETDRKWSSCAFHLSAKLSAKLSFVVVVGLYVTIL